MIDLKAVAAANAIAEFGQPPTIADCIARQCTCEGGDCHFDRCTECDGLVDSRGFSVDPRGGCKNCKPEGGL